MSAEFMTSLHFVSAVSSDAAHRISSRVMIEAQDIPLTKLPLGGEEGLDPILAFIPLAKEGFALDLKSNEILKDEIPGLLKYTTPDTLSTFAGELGLTLRARVVTDDMRLFLFRHSLTTIVCLSNTHMITSNEGISFWPHKPSNEDVWDILSEVEEATRRAILEFDSGNTTSTLRAAHFFAAGSKVARGMPVV